MKLNHEEVLNVLPHRPPMLFVDQVVELEPLQYIKTKLYIDETWEIFKGHFKDDPVFPGVLSVEAMAQATDIMCMVVPEYAGKAPLFAGIEGVRFFKRIDPGSTIYCFAKAVTVDKERALITADCAVSFLPETELTGEYVAAKATIKIAMR